jgi:hypothetical protein
MPVRSLPRHPSVEHLRNEARALHRRLREVEASAVALAREFHPRFTERAESFGLSDANGRQHRTVSVSAMLTAGSTAPACPRAAMAGRAQG